MNARLKMLLLLAMMLAATSVASAATVDQMKTTSPFDYSKFTYKWVDANGDTLTAKLTDKAENPRQIMALLCEVFTNPAIPGENYGYNYNGVKTGYCDYEEMANSAPWIKQMHPATVQNPVEGKTALLVEVYNDWDWTKAPSARSSYDEALVYFTRCYKSVQVLDRNKYIPDPYNPGYLFSINGLSTNKFFFLSKGKARRLGDLPIKFTYEQISPVISGNESSTTDFSSNIRNGNVYYMQHDCGDCPTIHTGSSLRSHEFTVAESGESYSFKNMTLFISDRRFEKEQAGRVSDSYCYYSSMPDSIRPKNLMYICTQEAPESHQVENEFNYQVSLKWNTSLDNEKLGVGVPQTYYIWATIDGERTLVDSTSDIQNYTYKVPMHEKAYTIKYTITASPIYSNIEAESNTREVRIPGMGAPFFMQAQAYRSRYDMDKEINIYKNTLSLNANTSNDYDRLGSVTEPYDMVRTSSDASVVIAHVAFGGKPGAVSYTVTYEDGTQDGENLFDSEEPVTTGILAKQTDMVIILDRFSASTKTNEQPGSYSYQLRRGSDNGSDPTEVPVYKTESAVTLQSVTKDEVDADTKHTLAGNKAVAIGFEVIKPGDANIQEYTVYRDALTDANRSGKAEPASGDSYNVTGRATDGSLSVKEGSVTITGTSADVTVTDYKADAMASKGFVPVITTYYNGDASMPNTYGCDIKNVEMPSLTLSVDEGSVGRTKKWWAASGIYHAAYGATLTLTPSLPANIPNVYYYRLWRVEDGGAETLLNGLEENVDNTETKGWATTYGNLQWHYPDKKSAVSVRDIYIAEDKGVDKNVTYIARMYSTIVLPPQGAARKVQAATDKGYYISEDRITVKYSQETITGVADVEGAKQAVSVRYYNVAGQVSSTPFAGLNIERTTYSDGSVATRKVVK